MGTVRLDGIPVGTIRETAEGTEFTYAETWLNDPDAVPISLTLPLASAPYSSPGLHPFFENLLPEGWLLELSVRKLKLSKDDPFGILLATCADCVGAVEVIAVAPGDTP